MIPRIFRAALVSVILPIVACLLVACGEEPEPMGPDTREPSFTLVSNGGCTPEVITTRQSDTETLLFTFGVPQECMFESDFLLRAEIDGTPYGVDFGDWTWPGQEDVQGDVAYLAEQDEVYLNLPSPPNLGKAYDNGVYQSIIEFDPPVRAVEFYYSRQEGDRAWWGGQFVASVDSMPVRAMSGGFFVLDAVTLHSNSAWGMVDTWDSALLTASGDWITWLWFYGRVHIDDLKITRATTPEIECNPRPVTRGDPVVCQITRPVDSVSGWHFEGADSLPVSSTSSSTSWSGTAVLSGSVAAIVAIDGDTATLQGNLQVRDRYDPAMWRWDESHWTFDSLSSALPGCENYGPLYVGTSTLLGRHRRAARCAGGAVVPDYALSGGVEAGYDAVPVSGGGPNDGLWYVTAVHYGMHTAASINPFFLAGYSPPESIDPGTFSKNQKQCKRALEQNLNAPPYLANFFDYNRLCGSGDPTAPGNLVYGLRAHEGMGMNPPGANANGHEGRLRHAAADSLNDPRWKVEKIVGQDESDLRDRVAQEVQAIDGELETASDAVHEFVKDNFVEGDGSCGKAYIFNPFLSKYELRTIKHEDGDCI